MRRACASASRVSDPAARTAALELAERLTLSGRGLLILADEDAEAMKTFSPSGGAPGALPDKQRLCELPVDIADLTARTTALLQAYRASAAGVQDDLEMAITLLEGAARASLLLLEANLRLWPDASLLERFEPELARLREQAASLKPVQREP